MSQAPDNRRILIVDDNASIHADYRKILGGGAESGALADAKAAFFGAGAPAAAEPARGAGYEMESAYQGEEAIQKARQAREQKKPFALAFVDVRMPPGIDGVETTARLWEADADLQVVLCTAFADYSWEEMSRRLGKSDQLLILKKPFDTMEVVQLATALTEKWNSRHRERQNLEEARRAEQEARSYAASLATFNRALETAKASAEASSASKSEFLGRLAAVLQQSGAALLSALELAGEPGLEGERRRESLDRAQSRCEEICKAARNLALQAGLELDTLEVQQREFAPGQLLDEVAARWRPRAQARGLTLACESLGALPARMLGDEELVQGILDALVDNALRFTERGTVRLEGRVVTDRQTQEPELQLSVTDTGTGIAVDAQPRVFEPLARAREAEEGAHFSLYTARRLARHLGGDLELESEPGRGSSFRLHLVLCVPEGSTHAAHPASALPAASSRASAMERRA